MSILRWILLTALAVAFLLLAVANWTPVPFHLPDGAVVFIRLPLLLAIAFIAGWLPTWLLHLGTKATLKRKLAKSVNGVDLPPPISTMPSQAQPIIVPPAGA